ncbi:hypothetical protein [Paenibacillus sinopodophylli]|nr:hypothetical protein [Paenibacillus sinopodophylli]
MRELEEDGLVRREVYAEVPLVTFDFNQIVPAQKVQMGYNANK